MLETEEPVIYVGGKALQALRLEVSKISKRLKGVQALWHQGSKIVAWLRNHWLVTLIGFIFTLLATDWFVFGQNVRKLIGWFSSLLK